MSTEWRPKEGRMYEIKLAWKIGEISKFKLIKIFLDSLPQFTYPIGGEQGYYRSEEKHGHENPIAPHNLWRQAWHSLGSAIPMALCMPWGKLVSKIGAGCVIAYSVLNESKDVYHNWHTYKWQSICKSSLDVVIWSGIALIFVYFS